MKAKELMSTFFVEVSPSASVRLAAELMRHENVGLICICDERSRPLGVLTDRDIAVRVCALQKPPETTQVQEVMSTPPVFCSPEDDVETVQALMGSRRLGRLLVLDGTGQIRGLISLAEIWHHESPLSAGPLSRSITEGHLRPALAGGHYTARG